MAARILLVAGRAALSLLLAAVIGALTVLTVLPRVVDGAALTVLTGSMSPGIPAGSVVVVRPVDPGELQVGDVVTFQPEPGVATFVTHRVAAIDPGTDPATLTTKGDANRGADVTPVPVTSVRGEVWFSVPHLGTVREALSVGPGGLGILLGALALGGYAVAQVLSAARDRRAAGRQLLQLLVVVLPQDGDAPALAGALGMDLQAVGDHTVTLTAVGPPARVDEVVAALPGHQPLHVVRSSPVAVPGALGRLHARDEVAP